MALKDFGQSSESMISARAASGGQGPLSHRIWRRLRISFGGRTGRKPAHNDREFRVRYLGAVACASMMPSSAALGGTRARCGVMTSSDQLVCAQRRRHNNLVEARDDLRHGFESPTGLVHAATADRPVPAVGVDGPHPGLKTRFDGLLDRPTESPSNENRTSRSARVGRPARATRTSRDHLA